MTVLPAAVTPQGNANGAPPRAMSLSEPNSPVRGQAAAQLVADWLAAQTAV
jgi:hypothetical protein